MEPKGPANPESGEGPSQHVISISDTVAEGSRISMASSDASVQKEDKEYKPFIGQVPMVLQKIGLKRYFEPRIVSIGPVHHEQGQEYKRQLADFFIKDYGLSEGELWNNILKEIESFKECYDQELLEKFNGDDQKLARMFVLDGCALIEFVNRYVTIGMAAFCCMNIDRDQVNLMVTDLILIDNQLPLGVLNLLMKSINKEDYLRTLIGRFARKIMGLVHSEECAKDLIFGTGNHMLELIWLNFVEKRTSDRYSNRHPSSGWLRGVKGLQAAGIILEPNNSSSFLRDISFKSGIPRNLKIPIFHVSEEGKFLVFNLIAFEMHPNFDYDPVVTSYMYFLDSILEDKEDVAELRKLGILINRLPNDEEVSEIFKELFTRMIPFYDTFSGIKKGIARYLGDTKSIKQGKLMGEIKQVHFRSAWTTIGVISATFLLIMTFIQTVLSILTYAQRR